ncbi:MAG: glutathione S-transferase family protein [Alphaproteobacteria bacterium]|nr:glutathione S-transferase family protein [Alphaproteobacteria bacterium]
MAFRIVVGDQNYSSWSLRGWLPLAQVAAKTGVGFEEVLVRLDKPDTAAKILSHSPNGRVPCLIHDGLVIWDSLAISEYLAEAYPQVPLWPAAVNARARARSVVAEMHSSFQALRGAFPMNIRLDQPNLPVTAEVKADLSRIDGLWHDCRKEFGQGGRFLFGAEAGIADWFYAPVVMRILSYHLPGAPEALDYCAAVKSHPLGARWGAAAEAENWELDWYKK